MILIPSDANYNTQKAFRDIDTALEKIKKQIDSLSSGLDAEEIEKLKAKIAVLATRPTTLDFRDIFRGAGGAHAIGYVPDPGPYDPKSGLLRVLHENGEWRFPLDGLAQPVPSDTGRASTDQRVLNILASLAVLNGVSADSLRSRIMTLQGVNLTHNAWFARAYSGTPTAGSNGNSGSGETTLTPYSFSLPGNSLDFVGSGFELYYTLVLTSTEAGTKTFKFYAQQSGSPAAGVTLWTSTTTTLNLVINGRMIMTRRTSSNTLAITGINNEYTAAAPTTVTFYGVNSGALTGYNFTLPTDIKFTLTHTGGTNNVILLTDVRVLPHTGANVGDGV